MGAVALAGRVRAGLRLDPRRPRGHDRRRHRRPAAGSADAWADIGPALYGHNIATGNRTTVFLGYLLGAGLMVLGGLTEVWLGVDAEQETLEDIAQPITAEP